MQSKETELKLNLVTLTQYVYQTLLILKDSRLNLEFTQMLQVSLDFGLSKFYINYSLKSISESIDVK